MQNGQANQTIESDSRDAARGADLQEQPVCSNSVQPTPCSFTLDTNTVRNLDDANRHFAQ